MDYTTILPFLQTYYGPLTVGGILLFYIVRFLYRNLRIDRKFLFPHFRRSIHTAVNSESNAVVYTYPIWAPLAVVLDIALFVPIALFGIRRDKALNLSQRIRRLESHLKL